MTPLPVKVRRRSQTGATLVSAVLLVFVACTSAGSAPPSGTARNNADVVYTPTVDRVRTELASFTGWLHRFNQKGYVGEVGWPAENPRRAREWNEIGEAWYRDADAAELWVSYWSAGEWWPSTYPLAVYTSPDAGLSPVSRAGPQSEVIEAHPSTTAYSRGVTVSGGEFTAPGRTPDRSDFSNTNPGRYDEQWHYERPESLAFLAQRRVGHIRLPLRWERIQPSLGGPLDRAEVARLNVTLDRAAAAGLKAILDVHNYGGYRLADPATGQGVFQPIGSPSVTADHFIDLWRRMSAEFRGNPGVLAYGLMNEPQDLPGSAAPAQARLWEQISQGALDAIRDRGDDTLVMVPGYAESAAGLWPTTHPRPWIKDRADHFRYEAHQYFDEDHSGDYREPILPLKAVSPTIVSLTFDDVSADQYITREILAARGMKATFFVNSNLTGRDAYYMTWDQVRDLADDGNEIGGHTLDDVNLTLVDHSEARRQVCEDRQNLLRRNFAVTHFAYPYAGADPALEAIVKECGYAAARGVGDVACPRCPTAESIPPADPYHLRTPDGITTAITLAEMKRWVRDTELRGGGWIQFVFHRICDRCADNAITESDFVELLDWLQKRGTVVKTIAEALRHPEPVGPPPDPGIPPDRANPRAPLAVRP